MTNVTCGLSAYRPVPASAGRGPAPTRKTGPCVGRWPWFFLKYRSLCPPCKTVFATLPLLLDSGAGADINRKRRSQNRRLYIRNKALNYIILFVSVRNVASIALHQSITLLETCYKRGRDQASGHSAATFFCVGQLFNYNNSAILAVGYTPDACNSSVLKCRQDCI